MTYTKQKETVALLIITCVILQPSPSPHKSHLPATVTFLYPEGGRCVEVRLYSEGYRMFSQDITAILVSHCKKEAAMLVSQTNPVGVELLS